MHNNNTKKTVVNTETTIYETPNGSWNDLHLNKKKDLVHWSGYNKGVVNLEISKFENKDSVQIDITETNIETQHEKRVMLDLNAEEIEALKTALNNLK